MNNEGKEDNKKPLHGERERKREREGEVHVQWDYITRFLTMTVSGSLILHFLSSLSISYDFVLCPCNACILISFSL